MDRTAYDRFFELELTHFWRIGKRRLVLDWMRRYGPTAENLSLLDIGGACSLIPKELGHWGAVQVIESDEQTVEFAREKLGVDIRQGKFPEDFPAHTKFDVVTMFDVLEHIEDDTASLRAVWQLLKPGGVFLCTVPALKRLWSDHDVVLHHFRRYSRKELKSKLEGAGFTVRRISFYTGILLPALMLQRMAAGLRSRVSGRRKTEYDVKPPPAPLNRLFDATMSFERWMLRWTDCWIGSSLIAVACKS